MHVVKKQDVPLKPRKDRFIEAVIENEGGIDNLYFDDGYHTVGGICYEHNTRFFEKNGITCQADIDKLSIDKRYRFYEDYAISAHSYDIQSYPLRYTHFDNAFNRGRRSAMKDLQRTINILRTDRVPLIVDGLYGPLTARALRDIDLQGREIAVSDVYNGIRREMYHKQFKVLYYAAKTAEQKQHAYDCLVAWLNRCRTVKEI